jgi:WD40 repeat protein
MQVYLSPPYSPPSPELSTPTLATASLELKAEKQSAHNDGVMSVVFSPDGSTIVSGSYDQTIKVWDAGTLARHIPHPAQKISALTLVTASLELKAEKQSAHSDFVRSVAFSPDGKTIVSGSYDQTIKVWDAGVSALTPLNP